MQIVAESPYETTDPTIDSQIVSLKASGADVFYDLTIPNFAAQAIKKASKIECKPIYLLNSVSNSVGGVIKPAGFDISWGILSTGYVKDPTDPQRKNDPAYNEWVTFMDKYYPAGDRTSTFTVYGYSVAQTMVQVLKQCGDNLIITPDNVMWQAANIHDLQLGILLPGITINTSPIDFAPIKQMQMERFNGQT
jgi:branched-chain amino acid transport system substrate-binding protein